jgi:dTDP-4-dehydrorhamnose reductase
LPWRAGRKAEVIALGRPAFDLTDRATVLAGLEEARPDVVVNAAAYTAVDKAGLNWLIISEIDGLP